MISVLHFLINAIFVFSVFFIWLMLLYQFVLCIGGFCLYQRLRREQVSVLADADLPQVSVLIPARNEEMVIGQLLGKIQELDYPAEKIEVIVINDGSTDQTAEIVASIAEKDPRFRILTIPKESGGQGKGAALNLALKQVRNEAIVVYDADNAPEKDSLRLLCSALVADKRLAAVCGKFRAYNKNRNLLTRLINLEGIAFQWIIQAGRWYFLKISFIPGTNFVIWKHILEKVGAWDSEALTEDSELTFRIYEKGYLIRFLPTATSWEQEPERLSTWIRQRTRWARGNQYLIGKYARKIFKPHFRLLLAELLNLLYLYYFFIFAIVFSDLLFVLSLLGVVRIQVVGPYGRLWALAFLLYIIEILLALSFEREDKPGNIYVAIVAYLTYTKLWAYVVLRSLYLEYIARSKRTWAKTERFDMGSSMPNEKKKT
jgi:cellulose synthase/poly-beta-1,6-N-acetylglucosamine synthase-like glycosyltransferase